MNFENNDILKSNLKENISLYKINKMKNITTNKIGNKELYRNINVSYDNRVNIKSNKTVNYLNKMLKKNKKIKKSKNLNKNMKKKLNNKEKKNH